MADDDESFLTRWSRRKQQALAPAATPVEPDLPAAPLPALDSLTMESDFSGFMQPAVDEGLRRDALKRLFADPHFNQMDGLDVYIDDFSKFEPISSELLAQLVQARNTLGLGADDAPAAGPTAKLLDESAAPADRTAQLQPDNAAILSDDGDKLSQAGVAEGGGTDATAKNG